MTRQKMPQQQRRSASVRRVLVTLHHRRSSLLATVMPGSPLTCASRPPVARAIVDANGPLALFSLLLVLQWIH